MTAKNSAETMIAASEKALKEAGDKAPEDVRKNVEEKIKEVKEVIGKDGASKEEIEKSVQALSDELSKIGQAMYGAQGQTTGDSQQTTAGEEGNGEEKKADGANNGKKDEKVEEGQVVDEN